jgi:hypothetical protein
MVATTSDIRAHSSFKLAGRGGTKTLSFTSLMLSWFSWTANKWSFAAHFLSSHLQHKVDPGLAPYEIHNQFQWPDFIMLKQSFLLVIFCDTWSWIFFEQKWVVAIHKTTNNTAPTLHQYMTLWLAGFLSSYVWVECHLAVRMNTWGVGATNVPDQTVTSSSDVTTAHFCITNLGPPSILKWAV